MPRLREFRWSRWASFAVDAFAEDKPALIAIDTETTGVGFYDEPFGATVTWRNPAGGELSSWYFELTGEQSGEIAHDLGLILSRTPTWVGHNLKFDLQKLVLAGVVIDHMIDTRELHDTQTMYHLLDENDRKGLKYLAVKVLGYDDTIDVEIKSGPNKGKFKQVPREEHRLATVRRKLKLKKEDGYHLLPREALIPYALRDTEFTLALYEKLLPQIDQRGLREWYETEMKLTRVLHDMEAVGLDLDIPYLEETASAYGVTVMQQWQEVVKLTGNPDLNLNSPAQLTEVFRTRGLHLESTAAAELKKLDDPLAAAILAYRDTFKLYKTYLKGLLEEQRDGCVHPSFNPTGARTGRLSSGSAKE